MSSIHDQLASLGHAVTLYVQGGWPKK